MPKARIIFRSMTGYRILLKIGYARDGSIYISHGYQFTRSRIYAADIQGDSREEVIMLDEEGVIKIFWNSNVNASGPKPRYWKQQHYRRQKQNWNYYSP